MQRATQNGIRFDAPAAARIEALRFNVQRRFERLLPAAFIVFVSFVLFSSRQAAPWLIALRVIACATLLIAFWSRKRLSTLANSLAVITALYVCGIGEIGH